MPCPTCDHTMQGLGTLKSGPHVFWCPRCGTIRTQFNDYVEDDVPKLPIRTAQFINALGPSWTALAHRLGVTEACTKEPNVT
jgi:hypothetical protein